MPFDPVSAALEIGGKLIDRLIPDPSAKAAAQLKLMEMAQAGELAHLTADTDLAKAQLAVNQVEAANANLFVAGWRPAIGWICGAGLGYEFLLRPFLIYVPSLAHWTVNAPELPMGDLQILLTGMLGFGVMRSFDKSNGTATSVGGVVLPPVKPAIAPQPPIDATEPVPAAAVAPASPPRGGGWFRRP